MLHNFEVETPWLYKRFKCLGIVIEVSRIQAKVDHHLTVAIIRLCSHLDVRVVRINWQSMQTCLVVVMERVSLSEETHLADDELKHWGRQRYVLPDIVFDFSVMKTYNQLVNFYLLDVHVVFEFVNIRRV